MQNLNHLVSLLQEGYTTIGVVFAAGAAPVAKPEDDFAPWYPQMAPVHRDATAGAQIYTYKCHFECIVGDMVIVPPSGAGKLPSIATVVRLDSEPELNFESGVEYKWAIGRVDTSAYDNTMQRERDLIRMLRENQKKEQRAKLLASYQLSLPEDENSRKIFDQARQIGLPSKDI